MDLGSLELQIFVSLTVVLGAAFVALVCDYLKGNNEQLREHNIELRVRKEEQDRQILLDPSGFVGQVRGTGAAYSAGLMSRPVGAHEMMQSFATQEALADAESRVAMMHARTGEDYMEAADVPPLTPRRGGRSAGGRRGNRRERTTVESSNDWVRPEVFARVARRAEASEAYASDIRDEIKTGRDESRLEPLNAPDAWDIRDQLSGRDKNKRPVAAPTPEPVPVPEQPVQASVKHESVQTEPATQEIERVSQSERPSGSPSSVTILRPLTVPSLKLEEEIQRVAEVEALPVPVVTNWNSPLLEEVIAASAMRVPEADIPAEVQVEAPAAADQILSTGYEVGARVSELAGMGVAPSVEYLPSSGALELPDAKIQLSNEPALLSVDEPHEFEEFVFEESQELVEPPPVVEPEPVCEVATTIPELLFPTGMQDLATWMRLVSLPNPMSGFLFVITVETKDHVLDGNRKGSAEVEGTTTLVDKLMSSFVRDGDFGARLAENEWVFVYPHDGGGLNQRRMGMITERLWDFKLRHLELANVDFKWGAIDVKTERLNDALEVARSRMDQSRNGRKLPGAYSMPTRQAVNA